MEKWINMSRILAECDWLGNHDMVVVWTYLLLHAAHDIDEYRGVTVARGQVAASRRRIVDATGLSEQQIRAALQKLAKRGRITIQATNQCTVVTIKDFDQYCRTER